MSSTTTTRAPVCKTPISTKTSSPSPTAPTLKLDGGFRTTVKIERQNDKVSVDDTFAPSRLIRKEPSSWGGQHVLDLVLSVSFTRVPLAHCPRTAMALSLMA